MEKSTKLSRHIPHPALRENTTGHGGIFILPYYWEQPF